MDARVERRSNEEWVVRERGRQMRGKVSALTDEVHPEAVYQALLDQGIFALQWCNGCNRAVFSPRVMCPHCGVDSLRWVRSHGAGTVYSTTTVYPRSQEPYPVCLVDLDEGVRMMSSVIDVPADEVAIGMRVQVQVETLEGEGVPYMVRERA